MMHHASLDPVYCSQQDFWIKIVSDHEHQQLCNLLKHKRVSFQIYVGSSVGFIVFKLVIICCIKILVSLSLNKCKKLQFSMVKPLKSVVHIVRTNYRTTIHQVYISIFLSLLIFCIISYIFQFVYLQNVIQIQIFLIMFYHISLSL